MPENTSAKRRYNGTRRREQASRTREEVVRAAGRVFVEHGYASATIAQIAAEAGVAVETVYRSAAGKAGLLSAAVQAAMAGGVARADVPREQRPAVRAVIEESDPRRLLDRYAEMITDVYRRVGPLLHVLDNAAAADPALAEERRTLQRQRLDGQRRITRLLSDRGDLRPGLAVDTAADILFALNSPAMHDSLVLDRGWTPEAYRDWLSEMAARALLR